MRLPLPLKELLRRIDAKTEKTASCWLWNGPYQDGVPMLRVKRGGRKYRLSVRRVVWLSLHESIPPFHRVLTRCGLHECIRAEHCRAIPMGAAIWHASKPGVRFRSITPTVIVQEAVRLYHAGLTAKEVATRLGIKRRTVYHYVTGRARSQETGIGFIPGGFWMQRRRARGEVNGSAKLSWQEVLIAMGLQRAGYTRQTIAQALSVPAGVPGLPPRRISCSTIGDIIRGTTWKDLTAGLIGSSLDAPSSNTPALDMPHPDEALVWQHWPGGHGGAGHTADG